MWYRLEGKKIIPVLDIKTIKEPLQKHINDTTIEGVRISTVFSGLDHGYYDIKSKNHKPIVFETMVFGGFHDGYCNRYSTWNEAAAGHKLMCKIIKNSLKTK